ncbi:hypothetical protein B0H14DRAFT_3428840 [Mycena olivaceomarginata]|nr:hypothetical protein B0H14DRAFT_3428840 [Mycena olivaceomarginata]
MDATSHDHHVTSRAGLPPSYLPPPNPAATRITAATARAAQPPLRARFIRSSRPAPPLSLPTASPVPAFIKRRAQHPPATTGAARRASDANPVITSLPALRRATIAPPRPLPTPYHPLLSPWGIYVDLHLFSRPFATASLSAPGVECTLSPELECVGNPGLNCILSNSARTVAPTPPSAPSSAPLTLLPRRHRERVLPSFHRHQWLRGCAPVQRGVCEYLADHCWNAMHRVQGLGLRGCLGVC